MKHEKNCSSHLGYVCTCSGRRKEDVCPYCRKLKNYCTGDFAGCHERDNHTPPHTHECIPKDYRSGCPLCSAPVCCEECCRKQYNRNRAAQAEASFGKIISSEEIK